MSHISGYELFFLQTLSLKVFYEINKCPAWNVNQITKITTIILKRNSSGRTWI